MCQEAKSSPEPKQQQQQWQQKWIQRMAYKQKSRVSLLTKGIYIFPNAKYGVLELGHISKHIAGWDTANIDIANSCKLECCTCRRILEITLYAKVLNKS